jgi:NAD(P)-dependent dehydrogenase (short-subunit alcohol dehydrogenase family)
MNMGTKERFLNVCGAARSWIKKRVSFHPAEELTFFLQNQEAGPAVPMGGKLLSGKNALVTGAGRNIGRSIALEMAGQGANILFLESDKERCVKLQQELREYGVISKGFISDVSKTEDIETLHSFLVQEKMVIDILVNNVGTQFEKDDIQHFDLAKWNEIYRSNVFGPMYLTKHVSGLMISRNIQGCILFVTSIHQSVPGKWICYSSTKGALGMIVKELSLDLASHGIRVNGIAPGWVSEDERDTPCNFKYAPLHKTSINPCYIGRAAVYLASDYFSRFTTGSVITIDAGLSLFHYQMVNDLPPQ